MQEDFYNFPYFCAFRLRESCVQADFAIFLFDFQIDKADAHFYTEHILKKLGEIEKQFPGYTVEAGTIDEMAGALWAHRYDLPVVTEEIGDTWIHGSAADPYKSAALRELMARKRKWLADGSMTRESAEYAGLCDALLCIAEHTCGMDMKNISPITNTT